MFYGHQTVLSHKYHISCIPNAFELTKNSIKLLLNTFPPKLSNLLRIANKIWPCPWKKKIYFI